MSDLTTYRQMTEAEDEAHRYPACPHVEDHRLRDIADAWNYDDIGQGRYEFRQQWSELADLLDALGGADNDD